MKTTFRYFMRRNFLGTGGIIFKRLDKAGNLKAERSQTWPKAGPRYFFSWIIIVILWIKLTKWVGLDIYSFNWLDLIPIIMFLLTVYFGFIYPSLYPLQDNELNYFERNRNLLK